MDVDDWAKETCICDHPRYAHGTSGRSCQRDISVLSVGLGRIWVPCPCERFAEDELPEPDEW